MLLNENNQQNTSDTASEITPEQPTQDTRNFSRRKLLLGATAVGGSLAVVAGAAVLINGTEESHAQAPQVQFTAKGQLREYWIQADSWFHNLVSSGYDGMMAMQFKPAQSSYWAIGFRAYTPGWGKLVDASDSIGQNDGIPGPVLRGSVGDTIRVHFRNNDTHYNTTHSMHPHGVLYTTNNDGAWYASNPRPGSAIPVGQSYTYEWQVRPNSVGTWVYHDHATPFGPNMLMEYGAELGLFGMLVLTDSSTPAIDYEFFTFLHDLYQADVASLAQDFDCFNGHSYLGNTPTFTARINGRIRWHVGALGKEFHVFHLHGHRWKDESGRYTDTVHLGPAIATYFDFVADNPGQWLYHCHVTDHMMGGMVGMYTITQ